MSVTFLVSKEDKSNAFNLEQSVNIAYEWAKTGDTILLSPACSSYDQYPNFEIRGKHFKDLVNSLKAK